jgi:carbohydrate diacid regulator
MAEKKSISAECMIGQKDCVLHNFFAAIPREVYKNTLSGIETEEIRKVLSDPEELKTCEVFLRNNLNIKAASKELFMHRNTLIYRLEKIRNSTGLDLKKFCDAFVFHILMFKNPAK